MICSVFADKCFDDSTDGGRLCPLSGSPGSGSICPALAADKKCLAGGEGCFIHCIVLGEVAYLNANQVQFAAVVICCNCDLLQL